MTIYSRAKRHAWWMLGALVVAILFVLTVDMLYGHSSIAFALAILGLVVANARMLTFNCPRCGKNLFFRGHFAVPWPNHICGRCGLELRQPDQR